MTRFTVLAVAARGVRSAWRHHPTGVRLVVRRRRRHRPVQSRCRSRGRGVLVLVQAVTERTETDTSGPPTRRRASSSY